jgi:hypothetical protein
VTSAADSATLLLTGAVGYVFDAGLDFANFMEPGASGFIAAALGLGGKKAIDARRSAVAAQHAEDALFDRGLDVMRFLTHEGFLEDADRLGRDLRLVRLGALDPSVLEQSITRALSSFRSEG